MATISVVITAFNEEKKIEKALKSVKNFADEIIVVDNGSSDKTVSIAKRYTKKVFSQKNNPGDIDRQKNFGFYKATKDWTLSLDADERVTPELVAEIKSSIGNSNSAIAAYWIPRRNIIFGKQIMHTGWYPDFHLRLFKTGKGKFVNEHVHEDIYIEGEKEYLHTDLLHEHYQTVEEFIHRNLLVYAKNEAKSKIDNGYVFSYSDALWFPVREFLSRYFAREGYKDGFHGLILSLLLATYHLAIFAYIWEHEKFSEEKFDITDFASNASKIVKETHYWITTSQIQNENNPLKKTILKVKRKI